VSIHGFFFFIFFLKNPEIQVKFENIIEHFKSQGKNYNVNLKNKVEDHIIQYTNLLDKTFSPNFEKCYSNHQMLHLFLYCSFQNLNFQKKMDKNKKNINLRRDCMKNF
jgi:hypothetical protein